MRRYMGPLILSDESHADLIQKIDGMDLGKLEPWHSWLLAMISNAAYWEPYHGDGSEFDPPEDDA